MLVKRLFLLICAAGLLPFFSSPVWAQLSTPDHLSEPGFWPTQNGVSRDDYEGPAVCASCHPGIAASQRITPMGSTLMHAANSAILHTHPEMNFAVGLYHYEIKTEAKGSIYTVTDGNQSLTALLLWAFGTGRVAQSFLFKKPDGNFYEARVTYFRSLENLNFTPGRALASPKDIEEAMYRPVGAPEISQCFACHATAANIGTQFDEKNLILGVTCEACHGPGAGHVAAMQASMISGTPDAGKDDIYNPARLDPADSVDFCGACHATWWDVKLSKASGVATAKSQPYRLENSKCWGDGDARLTCTACHDPHKRLQTDLASYDEDCLKCHGTGAGAEKTASHGASGCPVATKNCASCHMPKVYDPDMHYYFTDHWIRIVRPGEPYPE